MALTISLPDDAESRLMERARAAGQDVTQYVEQLITKELVAPLSLKRLIRWRGPWMPPA